MICPECKTEMSAAGCLCNYAAASKSHESLIDKWNEIENIDMSRLGDAVKDPSGKIEKVDLGLYRTELLKTLNRIAGALEGIASYAAILAHPIITMETSTQEKKICTCTLDPKSRQHCAVHGQKEDPELVVNPKK